MNEKDINRINQLYAACREALEDASTRSDLRFFKDSDNKELKFFAHLLEGASNQRETSLAFVEHYPSVQEALAAMQHAERLQERIRKNCQAKLLSASNLLPYANAKSHPTFKIPEAARDRMHFEKDFLSLQQQLLTAAFSLDNPKPLFLAQRPRPAENEDAA